MNVWLLFILAGLATFLTRLSFITLLDKIKMPDWFRRALRFVPPAVLSAIALPQLAAPDGAMLLTWRNPQLLAGAVAVLAAWLTKNVVLTICAGVAALLVLQLVL